MRALVLDSSTEKGLVAFLEEGKLLECLHLPHGFQSSDYLLEELQKGMRSLSFALSDLNFICVGVGPGSYTGLRVAAIAAKTLSVALQIPLVAISTLRSFIPTDAGLTFAVLIDAKIGGVYLQIGHLNANGCVTYHGEPCMVSIEKSKELLLEVPLIVTPNASSLKAKYGDSMSHCVWQELYPSPLHMYKSGLQNYLQNDFTIDGHLQLLYMRKTQAEIEKSLD